MEETNYPNRVAKTSPSPVLDEKTSGKGPSSLETPSPNSSQKQTDDYLYTTPNRKEKTFLEKLSLIHRRSLDQPNRLFVMAWEPLILLTFPVVAWCGFIYGIGLIWFNVLNDSTSLILTETYNFTPAQVGLTYISPILGVLVGHIYCGPVGDRFALWLARRRNGYLEAEFRLWLFLPCLLLTPGGLILYGVGSAHAIHWIGPVIATGVIAATAFVALQLAVAYCVDTYYALSSEAIVTVILVRNSMSFAVGYGITPWIQNMGLQNAFIVAAFAGLVTTATFLVYTTWGKRMRSASAGRYAALVVKAKRDAILNH
ncbi:MAG: hypothetical protein M1821_009678 [Bathelium mastoideum]|nr:MAG: hypothetical protein M1821_009678 [Bathelium mastoideum]